MWPFRKKEQSPPPEPTLPVCRHKWRDFPWYMEEKYSIPCGNLHIRILEPYVCVHCKERKDVVLLDEEYRGMSGKDIERKITAYHQQFAHRLQPRPIVEDMIHDMQLVDREYLDILYRLRSTRKGEVQ